MKILYLTSRQPFPYTKGDQSISYNQIKELSQKHEIYLVSFYESDYDTLYVEMNKYCKEVHLFKMTSLMKIISAMKTFINPTSIQANIFYRYSMAKNIDDLYLRIKPDVVHILTFRMAQYFLGKKVKKTIDLVDAYSFNMKKRRDSSRNVLRLLWHLEYKLLNKYESRVIKDFCCKTIVAKRDQEFLQDDSIIVNPIGIDIPSKTTLIQRYLFKIDSNNYEKELNLIFQGNMSYYPNLRAIKFLVKELIPEAEKRGKKIRLFLVGGNPSKEVLRLRSSKVIVTGYVQNMDEYLAQADIAVYPIFTATGMQTKILEALACRVPCIVSQQCMEGIKGLEEGVNILTANNLEEFVEKIVYISNYRNKVEEIVENGYNLVVKNYTWKRNVEELEKLWC